MPEGLAELIRAAFRLSHYKLKKRKNCPRSYFLGEKSALRGRVGFAERFDEEEALDKLRARSVLLLRATTERSP
jgi:hypothetical protein